MSKKPIKQKVTKKAPPSAKKSVPKKTAGKKYRHLFFDLDGTITRSKSLIAPAMRKTLSSAMQKGYDIIIVSGASAKQGQKQTENLPCYYLGQNGNHAFDGASGKDIWRHDLTPEQKKEIHEHIASLPRTWPVKDERDLVDDRGCQISYSLIGHSEDITKKEDFDPDHARRLALMADFPLNSRTIQVRSGGTTCLDYFEKGKHKGYNVAQIIADKKWKKSECIYLGDALFPGGNDETVVGVIETKQVESPLDTLAFLQEILK